MKKCKFYSCERYENLNPLNIRINFIMYFNLIHFRSKTTFTMSMYAQIMGNSPENIHFETWAWSWSWTWTT